MHRQTASVFLTVMVHEKRRTHGRRPMLHAEWQDFAGMCLMGGEL